MPGVIGVDIIGHDSEGGRSVFTYEARTNPDATFDVQQAVTRLAAGRGMTLFANEERTLDLEAVFLQLVGEADTRSSPEK